VKAISEICMLTLLFLSFLVSSVSFDDTNISFLNTTDENHEKEFDQDLF